MTIHNHGPEEGAGLACNELRLPDGSLKGACLGGQVHEKTVLQGGGLPEQLLPGQVGEHAGPTQRLVPSEER